MYEDFFDLREKPFSIQPDPAFMFWGRNHRLAYAMLEYGVLNNAGISVITGGVGCGKTTLLHRLLDQLTDTHTIALLSNIQPDRGNLLSWVLMGFNRPFSEKSHVELFQELQQFFIGEYSNGKRCVLIIDEAQNLTADMLEEIRMLSNINAGRDQLLQLILVGQPQLKEILNHPDMLQLTQRIGSDFHLTPLTPDEVHAYIDTRLRVAGASRPIFSDEAKALIASHSRGVPRVINILSDTALVYAFSGQEETVSRKIIETVIQDKQNFGVFGPPKVDSQEGAPAAAYTERANRPSAGPETFTDVSEPSEHEIDPPQPANTPEPPPAPPSALSAPTHQQPSQFPADDSPDYLSSDIMDSDQMRSPHQNGIAPSSSTSDELPAELAQELSALDEEHILNTQNQAALSKTTAPVNRATIDHEPLSDTASQANGHTDHFTMPNIGFVVLEQPGAAPPTETITSIGADYPVVFVTFSGDLAHGEAARAAGAVVVKMRGENETPPSRSRNAGFRQLRKIASDLDYVHFLDGGVILHENWLRDAAKFLTRHPEVAALEGFIGNNAASLDTPSTQLSHEEIKASGDNVLIRVKNFVDLGGFRGDLMVADVQDFCLRTRGRGAHIWRLETPMLRTGQKKKSLTQWWRTSKDNGFEHAFCAALHGGPPERYRTTEMRRSVVWGFIFPLMICGMAVSITAITYYIVPIGIPILWGLAVLAGGVGIYLTKSVIAMQQKINGRKVGLVGSIANSISHFPEFLGVLRFVRWRQKQKKKGA